MRPQLLMSALPPKADIDEFLLNARYGPKADIPPFIRSTSSAMASNAGGTVRPSAFAVFKIDHKRRHVRFWPLADMLWRPCCEKGNGTQSDDSSDDDFYAAATTLHFSHPSICCLP